MARNTTKGRRGWFGESARHAVAGRKGGKARGRNRNRNNNESSNELA
jgi:hypothetical protein